MRTAIYGAAAVVLLSSCGTPEQEVSHPAPPTQAAPPDGAAAPSAGDPSVIIPVPEVPSVAPPIEGSPQTRQPYLYAPGPTAPQGQFSRPLNPGPVTGYGPGGMAKPPGAPSNPPFHP